MKRIRVPEFLVSAVMSKSLVVAACNGKAVEISEPVAREVARRICESLSEHPQVPTPAQYTKLRSDLEDEHGMVPMFPEMFAEWQRRCFVQEEPEISATAKTIGQRIMGVTFSSADADYLINEVILATNPGYVRALRKGEQK